MLTEIVEDLVKTRLKSEKPVGFHVHTASMWPALVPGDLLYVKGGNDVAALERGAFLIFQLEDHWIVHRFIKSESISEEKKITTKGDNVSLFDPVWEHSALYGVGVEIKRDDRRISLTSRKARVVGRWIAALSSAIGNLAAKPATIFRSLCSRLLQRMIYGLSYIGYR